MKVVIDYRIGGFGLSEEAITLLEECGIEDPERRIKELIVCSE